MDIIEIKDQDKWNDFIISNGSQFLQSWEWAEFQKKIDRKIWRLCVQDNDIIGQALVIKYTLPLGKSYLYCPRGPIFKMQNEEFRIKNKELLELLFEKIKELAKQENAIFFRFEPVSEYKAQNRRFSAKKVDDIQPSRTLVLDLAKSEQEILSHMHGKTRYNIKLAKRHGVTIQKSDKPSIFLNLIHHTAKREKFKPHPDHYYRTLLHTNPEFARLYAGEYKGRVLAAHIMIFFGETATYVHGASLREYKHAMAPYLLHWHTINVAKEQGSGYYDFWGIDEKKWPGLSRFKKGFGGNMVAYPGTYNVPLSKIWYYLYKLGKKFV